MCASASERHSSSSWRQSGASVLVYEYVLWSTMSDKGLAMDWGASQPEASWLCKGSWWITGESQLFVPCQHLLPRLLAGRIPIKALNKSPGSTTAGRVSVSLHSLSVAGCMDSIRVIECVCAEENIWNVLTSELNTWWCVIIEQVCYTLNNKKWSAHRKHHYSGHIFYQPSHFIPCPNNSQISCGTYEKVQFCMQVIQQSFPLRSAGNKHVKNPKRFIKMFNPLCFRYREQECPVMVEVRGDGQDEQTQDQTSTVTFYNSCS